MNKNIRLAILLNLAIGQPIYASIWDDIGGAFKKAVNTVGDAFKEGYNWVKDRFKDTQTTRAIDYGVRKGALEAALATANGVLDVAQKAAEGTLVAAEETAKAGVTAAQGFMDGMNQVSTGVLQGPAIAAQGILEGVKQTTVGTITGAQFIITTTLGTFQINKINYKASLKMLESGVLGDVKVEGVLFKPFNLKMNLDVKKPFDSLVDIITKLFTQSKTESKLDQMQANVNSILANKTQIDQLPDVKKAEQKISKAAAARKEAEAALADIKKKQDEMIATAQASAVHMQKLAAISIEDLLDAVDTNQGRDKNRALKVLFDRRKEVTALRENIAKQEAAQSQSKEAIEARNKLDQKIATTAQQVQEALKK